MRAATALATVTTLMALGTSNAPDDDLVLASNGCAARLDARTGAIVRVSAKPSGDAIFRGGPSGLWQARLRDGTVLRSNSTGADGTQAVRVVRLSPSEARLTYASPDIRVEVHAAVRNASLDLSATAMPLRADLVAFELPSRLMFDPSRVRRFICPSDGNQSVGVAFERGFFMRQSDERPSGWEPRVVGPGAYGRLFGTPLVQRPDLDPPVTLSVTPSGREWLADAADRVGGAQAVVNRPPGTSPDLMTLVGSPNGPWLSALSLGDGRAWRIGGSVGASEAPLVKVCIQHIARRLLAQAEGKRRRIGVLSIERAPDQGGWSAVGSREWVRALEGAGEVMPIVSRSMLADELRSGRCVAILNPYGEWCPTLPNADMPQTAEAIARYVRTGGNWIETGGYPFFYALEPVRHYRYGGRYPAMFADFMHIDSETGSASVYRVQPLNAVPWSGATDPSRIFVPGELGCGSDDGGAYLDRSYAPLVPAGSTWRSPITRIALGVTAERSIEQYCIANGIVRRLAAKLRPPVLDRLKRSALLYCGGDAPAIFRCLPSLPRPTLLHSADYLRGGFDKEYPDHLPPRASFGTMDDLRRIGDRCRDLGLLWMPYTNPTWWCDNPRGPTFLQAGEQPLLRGLDGKPIHERYGPNDGWTVTFWHPAVRRANRETVRQFTRDVPADILFQDQCGARTWQYDTNPASPAGHAYIEGLLSMVAEDARSVPLSTESGWDRVAQYEAQLCGMTWSLVPTEHAPEWRRLMRDTIPPDLWTVYPLAQRIAHDKAAMTHHDLGQFVTNDEVLAWTLALGFGLSYRAHADALRPDSPQMEWLRWLDRVQKAICARYVGGGVRSFRHLRPDSAGSVRDDGVIEATYGSVSIAANLGPSRRTVRGRLLAPHGFVAIAPGATAARLSAIGSERFDDRPCAFVAVLRGSGRAADVWFYGPSGRTVACELPVKVTASAGVRLALGAAHRVRIVDGVVSIELPSDSKPGDRLIHVVVEW